MNLPGRVSAVRWGGYSAALNVEALFDLWSLNPSNSTLGTTPTATGATPPAVTFSGLLTTAYGIRIEIQTTGALGASTFRISLNNGSSYIASAVQTIASYDVPGTGPHGACLVANFPAGTYTNDNVYRATIATARDMSARAGDGLQPVSAGQPVFTASSAFFNGNPTWDFPGAVAVFFNSVFAADVARPLTIVVACKGNLAGTALNLMARDGSVAGGTSTSIATRSTATGGLVATGATAVTSFPGECSTSCLIMAEFGQTSVTAWLNGVFKGNAIDTNGVVRSFRLGSGNAIAAGGATVAAYNGSVADVRVANKAFSLTERRAVFKYFSDKHNIPIALAS